MNRINLLFNASRWTGALLLGSLLITPLQAKESPADFHQQIPLTLEGDGPWYSLNIPMDVQIAASQADLRDLRVFDAAGQALPFALVNNNKTQQTTSTAREGEAKLFPLRGAVEAGKPLPDIRIQQNGAVIEMRSSGTTASNPVEPAQPRIRGWLLDASTLDFPIERLQLEWNSAEEGFQSFTIETSDNLEQWTHWSTGQIARLSFEGNRIDVSEVKLPARRAKYLRLLWPADKTAVELKSARLLSAAQSTEAAPLNWSTPIAAKQEKDGEFRWQLPQALPIQRVRVTLPPELKNIIAPVDLSGRNLVRQNSQRQDNYWSALARGVLYRLPVDGRTTQVDELEIKYPQPVRELRLRVDNRGTGLGTTTPQLSFGMTGTRMVFLAQGTPPFQLAINNDKARAADLPMAVLIPGYDERKPPTFGKATLGKVTLPDLTDSAPSATTPQPWKKYGLWAVLLLGVGLLAVMAMSLVKKKKE